MAIDGGALNSVAINSAGAAQAVPTVSSVISGLPTPFISTDAAAVTVTDYSLSGASVTFGVTPLLGIALSWSGSQVNLQGQNPVLMMRYSDDSGHSWCSERSDSIGKIGETKKRVIFRRLGSSRNRVYEIKVSDPVKVTILGAELDVEEGTS
jgi:hypothetical protein